MYRQLKRGPHPQVLRTCFASPASTMVALASDVDCSARYVTDLLFMCAQILLERQSDGCKAVASSLPQGQGYWILTLLWDETQFRLVPAGERTGSDGVPVMAMHGHVAWDNGETRGEDDLVLCPVALDAASASCFYAGLKKSMPEAWWPACSTVVHTSVTCTRQRVPLHCV